eukprot:Hpha_TRINITY_DN16475_c3_g4::TRINITY_DN16475_c3_g4_i1::g.159588::m.159588
MPIWLHRRCPAAGPTSRQCEQLEMLTCRRFPDAPPKAVGSVFTPNALGSTFSNLSTSSAELMLDIEEGSKFHAKGGAVARMNQGSFRKRDPGPAVGPEAWRMHDKHEAALCLPTESQACLADMTRTRTEALDLGGGVRGRSMVMRRTKTTGVFSYSSKRQKQGPRKSLPANQYRSPTPRRPNSAPAAPHPRLLRKNSSSLNARHSTVADVRPATAAPAAAVPRVLMRCGIEEQVLRGDLEDDEQRAVDRFFGDETAELLRLHASAKRRHAELCKAREAEAADAEEERWQAEAAARQAGLAECSRLLPSASVPPSAGTIVSVAAEDAKGASLRLQMRRVTREAGLARTVVLGHEVRDRAELRSAELRMRPQLSLFPQITARDRGPASPSPKTEERPSERCRRKIAELEF